MIGIPTVEDVRRWAQIPASSVSDADLDQILAAELAIQRRMCRVPTENPDAGPVSASLDGMVATVTITGGSPNVHYRLSWGDGQNEDLTLDGSGNGETTHTYQNAGTYRAFVTDDFGTTILEYAAPVPGEGEVNPQAVYPPPLARACLRRCQREIAVRGLPLGAIGGDGTEYGPMSIPAWDAEIGRLEASYRIPVIA